MFISILLNTNAKYTQSFTSVHTQVLPYNISKQFLRELAVYKHIKSSKSIKILVNSYKFTIEGKFAKY